ncbi:MAG: tyrosine-type recombinase/integrase [Alphaproteobacteria bacterium]|nr:tyrosine-type recombinase/integrase [Alphaproteobacteria bacterium]
MRTISQGEPVRITKDLITRAWAQRQQDARVLLRDSLCRGLALVVNPTGMAWSYSYRPRGSDPATGGRWNNRTIKLGVPATMTAEQARIAAHRIKGDVASGEDPATLLRAKVAAKIEGRASTLGRLAEMYAVFLPCRPKMRGSGTASPTYVANELHALRAAIDEMQAAEMPAVDLEPVAVKRMLGRHGKSPAAAIARFGALSRFLDWLVDEERLAVNPCKRVTRATRPRPVAPRTHYLSVPQLATLWRAADKLPELHRDFLRMLIAIPCRRGEAASLEWQHLDLDKGVWTQPEKLTKNGSPHTFFLHPLILHPLRRRHAAMGQPKTGPVFAAPRTGRALTTWRDAKEQLVQAAGMEGWRLHDTRRSFATACAEHGVVETVADAVLNHRQSSTRGGVLGVYQMATRWPEQRAALELWGGLLAEQLRRSAFAKRVRPPRLH